MRRRSSEDPIAHPDPESIEPELLQPVPRPVRRSSRAESPLSLWALQLFLTILVGMGLYLAFRIGWGAALCVLGRGAPARILASDRHSGSEGSYYAVRFSYHAGGSEHSGVQYPDSFNTGASYEAVYLPVSPGWHPMLRKSGESYPTGQTTLVALGTFWNLLVLPLAWVVWSISGRQKRLVRRGTGVVGRVISVSADEGSDSEPGTLKVTYEFTPLDAPETVHGSTPVSESEGRQLQPGDTLTVLYDPNRPKINLAYRFGDFEALPAPRIT